MIQVRKLVERAATRLGVVNFGEPLDTFSSNVFLEILQMVLDELSIRTLNYKNYDYTVSASNPLVIGYSETVSGNIIEKPALIHEVIVKIGNINYPQNIKPYEEYQKIPIRNVNAIPNSVYIKYDEPFNTLYFFPGFGMDALVQILGRSYLTSDFLTLNDYIDLPREYVLGIYTNLALKAAGHFGVTPDQSLVIEASSGLKHIRQNQLLRTIPTLGSDLGGKFGFNFYSGTY